jgi:hypothetical protein
MLIKEHKSKRMAASLQNLYRYQDEGELFVESIVMGDGMWIYEFSPESERNSMSWKRAHLPFTKKKSLKF